MQIKIGKETFSDRSVSSCRVKQAFDLSLSELEPDTCSATVTDNSTVVTPLAASGSLVSANGMVAAAKREISGIDRYGYGEEVALSIGSVRSIFRVEEINRVAKNKYQIECISEIGLLKSSLFYGGIYNGISFAALVERIIGGAFRYTVDESISGELLYGWIPISTRRDALQQCLFSIGAFATKGENGYVHFGPMQSELPYAISDLYMGGSVKKIAPATKITVTEHEYHKAEQTSPEVLFEGEVSDERIITPLGNVVFGTVVKFSEPYFDLQTENAQLIEANANYAVVGVSASAKLTGKRYSHSQQVLQKVFSSGNTSNEYSVESCGTISVLNAETVLKRMTTYYRSSRQYSESFIMTKQKPGDLVSFENAFQEDASGYITEMDVVCSGKTKATAQIISGYTPVESGNYYSHLAVVTQSGTYTVPEECKGKIRVVVIGGGDGGEAGEAGQDGSAGPTYDSAVEAAQSGILSGEPGDGGAAGEAGSGGKVLIVTLDTKVGKKYSVSIGEGGAGAAVGETPGTGGETIFGAVSSAQGTTSTAGYAALIGDTLYATPGTAGIAGGRGQGVNPAFSDDGAKGERPTVSEGTESWQAGATAQSYTGAGKVSFGGTGGGAAVGSDGADGSRSALVEIPEAERPDKAVGGVGGKGATPRDAATGQLPGQGGQGGHGGGGGGGGGATYGTTAEEQSMTGGKGGSGGKGGDGAAGCVLIYY